VHGDGRVDEVAAKRPESRQDSLLVRTGESAKSDYVRAQDGRKFALFHHSSLSRDAAKHNDPANAAPLSASP
jgi:hypothetical protein